mgnify:CR=1 FL=1
MGVFVYPLAFYAGIHLAVVAVGIVVALGSGPVFAAILEWAVERRPLSRRWLLSTAIAVAGIVMLTIGKVPDPRARPRDTLAGVGCWQLGHIGQSPRVGRSVRLVLGIRDNRWVRENCPSRRIEKRVLRVSRPGTV